MRILLTNDDSIHAPGIKILANHLAKHHALIVAAPKREMSGVSHSFTIFSPLFIKSFDIGHNIPAFAIDGTPSDCVKIGVTKLCKEKPDLVISGFNDGENSGISSFYSGTVAGAREGVFFNIKSLSLSLCASDDAHYQFALQWLDRLLLRLEENEFTFNPASTYLNINFPSCPVEQINGTRLTKQGLTPFNDDYEERVNPSGEKYYWLFGGKPANSCTLDDEQSLSERFVSVTPQTIDSTDYKFLELNSGAFARL